ncbi:MAG: hypothetical protein Ct9H90mP22_3580 [Gammaproteobacteria bacterium]|nr:MAG: hypothetical protein Ct9H90mP22_3580 [Gammaproteobacteria bacterium]
MSDINYEMLDEGRKELLMKVLTIIAIFVS